MSRKYNKYKYSFFALLFLNLILLAFAVYIIYNNDAARHYLHSVLSSFNTENSLGPRNPPNGNYINGADVSEYQGVINWQKLKTDKKDFNFIFIRSTAGKNRRDRYFTYNWRQAKKNNIIRGAYHYYRPNENSKLQAENFIKNVKLSSGDLPPVLDIENTSSVQSINSLRKGISLWLKIIEEHYGVKPIIYSSASYYESFLAQEFGSYVLWVANYNIVKNPIKHKKWLFWQYSDKAMVLGIAGPVDLNVFNGSKDDLKVLFLR